ncbi:DUF4012 domain-containing protein [Candidatus Daviesbacteria bacterium]|nr:DUF4012 domain-containing protein [Candidatus Daviesbacteria bacterium]
MVDDLNKTLQQIDQPPSPVIPAIQSKISNPVNKQSRFIPRLSMSPKMAKVGLGVLFACALLYLLLVRPFIQVIASAKQASNEGKKIVISLKNQDLDGAKAAVAPTREKLRQVEKSLEYFAFLKTVPFLGSYYNDGSHALKAAFIGLDSVGIMIDIITPYSDLLGLKGRSNFMGGSPQERFQKVVQTIDKVIPDLDKLAPKFQEIRIEVDQIDPGRYPQGWFGLSIKSQISSVITLIQQVETLVVEARPALEVLPSIMGQPTPKRYLVLFQNDKELRPSGGFLTAYTYLIFDRGKIQATGSDDIYNLDTRLHNICLRKICPLAPPAPIVRYLPEPDGKPKTAWDSRDSNLSPDWKVSAQSFERFYQIIGGPAVDGIIGVDTNVIKEILGVLGPVRVGGYSTVFTKDNVVDELVDYSTIVFKGSSGRKQVLGDLMYSIMQYILQSGRDKIPNLINTGIEMGNKKHILVYFHDAKSQEAAEKFNWAGRIVDAKGDYLTVVDSNFAGGKANLFVVEKVTQEINILLDGTIEKTVTIDYDNPRAFHPDLNPTYRDWVRLFVPEGSTLLEQKGSQHNIEVAAELGKTVFNGYVIVPPQQKRQLVVKYRLPFKTDGNKTYKLLIQKQPGTEGVEYTIKINGRLWEKPFRLDSDRNLDITL